MTRNSLQWGDPDLDDSLATKARAKRFGLFEELIADVPRPIRILDIGGREAFWESMNFVDRPGIHITLLNLSAPEVSRDSFTSIEGDAANMPEVADNEYDIVFSNSVIEHLHTKERQHEMAAEVLRTGKRHFIQTPNFWFPMEPHFLVPGFQWMPKPARKFLLANFRTGRHAKMGAKVAHERVEEIRLIKRGEYQDMFPTSKIYDEKIFGLTKSFIAYGGW